MWPFAKKDYAEYTLGALRPYCTIGLVRQITDSFLVVESVFHFNGATLFFGFDRYDAKAFDKLSADMYALSHTRLDRSGGKIIVVDIDDDILTAITGKQFIAAETHGIIRVGDLHVSAEDL